MSIERTRTLVRVCCYLYIAQAAIGGAIGFAIPLIRFFGE